MEQRRRFAGTKIMSDIIRGVTLNSSDTNRGILYSYLLLGLLLQGQKDKTKVIFLDARNQGVARWTRSLSEAETEHREKAVRNVHLAGFEPMTLGLQCARWLRYQLCYPVRSYNRLRRSCCF